MSFQIFLMSGRLLTVLLFLLSGEIVFAQSYSVTDLGVLPGGSVSVAYAINNLGTVAGYSAGTSDAYYTGCGSATASKPVIWTVANGLQVLGPPPTLDIFVLPLKPCGGAAFGINNQGDVVGYLDYGFAGGFRSFIWTAISGMQLILGPVGEALGPGTAAGINSVGQVVGTQAGSAYRWTAGGVFDSLALSGQFTFANAINSTGQVAGAAGIEACNIGPVIWSSAGQLQALSLDGFLATLPSYTSVCSGKALGLNDNGITVGSVSIQFSSGDRGTFGWLSENNVAQALGALPLGSSATPFTEAYGINKSKGVVGQSNLLAFLWTPQNGIRDLNRLLDESAVGWTLVSGNAINEAGQIVGYGLRNGEPHAFLLLPTVGFLSFPVSFDSACGGSCTPSTAPMFAVFDHQMLMAYEQKCPGSSGPANWGAIVDFRGEKGDHNRQPPTGSGYGTCHTLYGYESGSTADPFLADVNYKGTPSNQVLWYDSHPGYDYGFAFGTKVYAATSGCISYTSAPAGVASAISFHVLTLIPSDAEPEGGCANASTDSGYFIYYLHLSSFLCDTTSSPSACPHQLAGQVVRKPSQKSNQIFACPECAQPATWIAANAFLGYTGDFARTWGGVSPHLHFEVDLKKDGILKPVDPYGWHPITAGMVDPYSQINPGFENLTLWRSFVP